MWKLPRMLRCTQIILYVLYIATTFKHDCFESLFGQLFGCPTAAYPGTDNNGIIAIFFHLLLLMFSYKSTMQLPDNLDWIQILSSEIEMIRERHVDRFRLALPPPLYKSSTVRALPAQPGF